MAIDKGHLPAVYAMGMIKISEGLPASNEGCDLLNALYDSVGDIWMFAQISGVVHSVLHNIVPHAIAFSIQDWIVHCPNKDHTLDHILNVGFGFAEETDACKFCKWYRDFQFLVTIFN